MKLQPSSRLNFFFAPHFPTLPPPLVSLCCGSSSRACIALAAWSIVSDFQQTNWPLGIYWQQTPQRQTQSWEHGGSRRGAEGVGEGFVGRERRKRRGTERQTDGRKDSERVSMWWNRKQVETHGETDQYEVVVCVWGGGRHPEFSLSRILFFWWRIRKWKKMAASYKDLINFEGSSAPLVQGRVQEGGREGGRQTPGLIRIHCR